MDDLIERKFGSCPFIGVSCEYVPMAERLAALEAELAIAQGYKDCGCSYDHPNDLCLGHEKLFKRLTDKRIAALEADNARLREALEQFLSLIEHQYCGSREAMNALQEADNSARAALGEKQ